jgi:hypothetical protein
MKSRILFTTLLTLAISAGLFSAKGFENGAQSGKHAVKQYVKEHVMPVLIQKRQLLESELSASERAEIAQHRTELKRLHQERRECLEQKPDNESRHEYMRASDPEFHKQLKAIMEKLQTIAANHSATLDKFKTDLAPSIKQWKSDIQNLHAQAHTQQQQTKTNTEQNYSQWHGGHGHGMEMLHGFTGPYAEAHFLLLPANLNDPNLSELMGEGTSNSEFNLPPSNTVALSNFRITPNPATTYVQIGNDPLPAQNQLFILDMQGKEVMTLSNVQPAQNIDLSQIANGSYMFQIKSGSQVESRKIVINR